MIHIHGEDVYGIDVDPQTGCGHWHGKTDIIAIKFKCCGRWYPCFDCHEAVAGHKLQVWPRNEFSANAILCGLCGHQLSVTDYLACDSSCPNCGADFNLGCAKHYHLYFEAL